MKQAQLNSKETSYPLQLDLTFTLIWTIILKFHQRLLLITLEAFIQALKMLFALLFYEITECLRLRYQSIFLSLLLNESKFIKSTEFYIQKRLLNIINLSLQSLICKSWNFFLFLVTCESSLLHLDSRIFLLKIDFLIFFHLIKKVIFIK